MKPTLSKIDYQVIFTHLVKYKNLYLIGAFVVALMLFFGTNNRGVRIGEKSNPIHAQIQAENQLIPDFQPGQSRIDAIEAYNQEFTHVAGMLEYENQVNLLRQAEAYRSLAALFTLNPTMTNCYQQSVFVCLNSFWSGRIKELQNRGVSRELSPDNGGMNGAIGFEQVNQNRQRITADQGVNFEAKSLLIALILAKEPNARTEQESLFLRREIPLFVDGQITASTLTPEPMATAQALSRLQSTQQIIGMSQGEITATLDCLRAGKSRQECANPDVNSNTQNTSY